MAKGSKMRRNKNSPARKAYVADKRWEINKLERVERHIKKHPNDKQSKERPKVNYIRKKPLDFFEQLNENVRLKKLKRS